MGDFRKDIKKHLESAVGQREKLLHDLRKMEKKIEALQTLLRLEEAESATAMLTPQQAKIALIKPSDFIIKKMNNGKPWALSDLKEEALKAGFFQSQPYPARSIMGVLMGLSKQKLISKVGDKWLIKKKAPQ